MKERNDTWSKILENREAIARKKVDQTTFSYGSVIPLRYYDDFANRLSVNIFEEKYKKIKIILNDNKYESVINYMTKNTGTKLLRISFSKRLKEILKKELKISYSYIIKAKDNTEKGKMIKVPQEQQEYIDFYESKEKDTFIIQLIKVDTNEDIDNSDESELDEDFDEIEEKDENEIISEFNINKVIEYIYDFIKNEGFSYDKKLIKNLYISLKTKPFVILSGISGTGKSKIVELFAKALGATSENKRFNLIPVKPDWSDGTELLGFRNIEGKFNVGIITDICYRAMLNPTISYFICLDEMNLARVEYYFSDILSLMETRRINEDEEIVTNYLLKRESIGNDNDAISKYGDVYIPQNVYIVGTVNMDETTFPFSKKVLDRANTIEFNNVDLNYSFDDIFTENNIEIKNYHNDLLKSEFLKIKDCIAYKDSAKDVIDNLISINNILEKYNYHFGYRVRDEILFYMIYAKKDNLFKFEEALDICIVQKILPKISGSSNDVKDVLIDLFEKLNSGYKFDNREYIEDDQLKKLENEIIKISSKSHNAQSGNMIEIGDKKFECIYKLSSTKLVYMLRRFIRDGFTTFWQ